MAPEHKAEIMRRLLNVVLLADHHHAGSFDFEDTTVFWEIGTYGLDDLSRERAGHSAPERVLTVLLAEEY